MYIVLMELYGELYPVTTTGFDDDPVLAFNTLTEAWTRVAEERDKAPWLDVEYRVAEIL